MMPVMPLTRVASFEAAEIYGLQVLETLDAIDAIVPPGTDLNPADRGWTPPALAPDQRRRPR